MGLNTRVIVYQRQAGQDGAGQPLEQWGEFTRLWCEIRHPSGLEAIRADAETPIARASIRIRRNPAIVPGMRVARTPTNGLVYDVQSILPDEVDRRYDFLVCEGTRA